MASVTPSELVDLIEIRSDLLILQGSLNPSDTEAYNASRIPGALLFDVRVCSDRISPLPFTIPPEDVFEKYVRRLEIVRRRAVAPSTRVIVYDASANGIVSAARIWWMFRLFGHDRVSVLSGGLAGWKENRDDVETGEPAPIDRSALFDVDVDGERFVAALRPDLVENFEGVVRNVDEKRFQLIDARSPADFALGSIAGAKNLRFLDVVDDERRIKSKEALDRLFDDAGIDLRAPLAAFCRSGVTTCCVVLAAFICGNSQVAVYDGSWTEWTAERSEKI